ncbi:4Fe-4S single cluster domain-containing protein [[Clostridium] aminophilum]|uniref:4Fe-4S single cluster domain-containing protein n=1 Tax=[Clostridium] aminophilum TaxID=1526 RepID=A0A1I0EEJ6_9FIRM|nr:radical SAM protein [[Clostridium] aminophilum]SET43394.1 4Fe-4S single cluster domain-containing protein [[Clostridium] aminophilum]
MGTDREYWLREFEDEMILINRADEIILYGRTSVIPLVKQALRDIRCGYVTRMYDGGKIEDEKTYLPDSKKVVILCGIRKSTRESMRNEADRVFQGSPCFSFLAIYYVWLSEIIHRPCDREELAKTIKAMDEDKCIPNIDSIITTYCNLRCKECSNGIPYRKEKKHISMEKQMNSIDLITAIRPILYCNIQGGEPLLNPYFPKWVRKHAENPRIAFITVATNGTMVPSEEACIAMRECGAIFRVSNYGELSYKKKELFYEATAKGVPCDIYARAESWLTYGELRKHGRKEKENRDIQQKCMFGKHDIMLYDGKLYCCCRTLFAEAVGCHNEDMLANMLSINERMTPQLLNELVEGHNLYRMCDYCDYPMNVIEPAAQIYNESVFKTSF